MNRTNAPPREGDLYKAITIGKYTFELRFGYYAEFERASGEPVVIYPDLIERKFYTEDGRRLVTAIQDPCPYYEVSDERVRDECCNDCRHYTSEEEGIGICNHCAMCEALAADRHLDPVSKKEGGHTYDCKV